MFLRTMEITVIDFQLKLQQNLMSLAQHIAGQTFGKVL